MLTQNKIFDFKVYMVTCIGYTVKALNDEVLIQGFDNQKLSDNFNSTT